jgi:hypothetical protein
MGRQTGRGIPSVERTALRVKRARTRPGVGGRFSAPVRERRKHRGVDRRSNESLLDPSTVPGMQRLALTGSCVPCRAKSSHGLSQARCSVVVCCFEPLTWFSASESERSEPPLCPWWCEV